MRCAALLLVPLGPLLVTSQVAGAAKKPLPGCPSGEEPCGTTCCPQEATAQLSLHFAAPTAPHCSELIASSNTSACFIDFWGKHSTQYSFFGASLSHAFVVPA
jgi:hypothetical protein